MSGPWERQLWRGEDVLGSTRRAGSGELHPQFDYYTFQGRSAADRHTTMVALDKGASDYPMVRLFTLLGLIDGGARLPEVRLVIVEGH